MKHTPQMEAPGGVFPPAAPCRSPDLQLSLAKTHDSQVESDQRVGVQVMARSRPWSSANADLRRRCQMPSPPIAAIEQSLLSGLSASSFKSVSGRQGNHDKPMPDRILTLPVMMAVVLSLVYRQIPSLSELLRVLQREGLLWVQPMQVSVEAVSKRLRVLPVSMFEEIFSWVIPRLHGTSAVISTVWQPVQDSFPVIWVADGSTLEQLRRHLKILRCVVSVLWDATWYCYLTNVLDPQVLPPHLVCELYRRRWRIEDAFALTKRLLGLAYIWCGDRNGVQIQIYATWIFYALLNDLCTQVAVALHQPLDKISLEMVFRGLYHYAQDVLQGTQTSLIDFLVEHHRLLALIKMTRKRQRKRDAQFQEIWGFPALS